ncbi:hypothetical protein ACFYP4_21945 [Streptomyces sp. NPDC005551]|uniref:DUF6197 family protein n=1 Tax=unclassified Streptomyces TaxID=2593676 RepID=UPI00340D030A
MSDPAPAPVIAPHRQPAAAAAPPSAALTLEARMAAADAAMTVRLEEAAVAHEVRTAHIPTEPFDLADVVTVPLPPALPPSAAPYLTPVAALLQRAHHRVQTDGWCAGALTDEDGAVCLLGALRREAGGDRGLEADAARVVLDTIRRQFGDTVDSVASFNDAHGTGRVPIRVLGRAAGLADARGL